MTIEQKLEEAVKELTDFFTTHEAVEHDLLKHVISRFAIDCLRSVRLERHDDPKETCCIRLCNNINALIASLGGDK